jgi:hypothetical protein
VIGTAKRVATAPLKRIPIFINSPRRLTECSFDIARTPNAATIDVE